MMPVAPGWVAEALLLLNAAEADVARQGAGREGLAAAPQVTVHRGTGSCDGLGRTLMCPTGETDSAPCRRTVAHIKPWYGARTPPRVFSADHTGHNHYVMMLREARYDIWLLCAARFFREERHRPAVHGHSSGKGACQLLRAWTWLCRHKVLVKVRVQQPAGRVQHSVRHAAPEHLRSRSQERDEPASTCEPPRVPQAVAWRALPCVVCPHGLRRQLTDGARRRKKARLPLPRPAPGGCPLVHPEAERTVQAFQADHEPGGLVRRKHLHGA